MTQPFRHPGTGAVRRSAILLFLAVGLLQSACSNYAKVSEKKVRFRPLRTTAGALVSVESHIRNALTTSRKVPREAIAELVSAADIAQRQLRVDPRDEAAKYDYNFAVSRIFTTLKSSGLDLWTQPLSVTGPDGAYQLGARKDARKAWDPSKYELTPADEFDMKGTYITKDQSKPGVGAPLVAVGKTANAKSKENFFMAHTYYGVTAVAHFTDRKCEISFEDPLAVETVELNGKQQSLAADFTVPLAVMLSATNPKKLELSRLLRPQKFENTVRLSRLQPYDPDKTVVLVIHGLMDSPATWAPMLNTLRGDEFIRKNYQFWFYSYPSGYPYPHSAALLRQQLDAIVQKFPLRHPMVVIGHSMGGCITRLLLTDTGDQVWKDHFGKSPAEMKLSPQAREILTNALIFKHRPEVGRAIFIAAPLRGSDLATNWIGRLGSRLVKAPTTLLSAGYEVMQGVVSDQDALGLRRMPNSVDTMSPKNRFVKSINRLPLNPGIPYHSIMGDRGKGGNPDHTDPVKGDGFVPYWSSRLDGALSELIVPSGHSAHQNPEAITEVLRILRLHAKVQR